MLPISFPLISYSLKQEDKMYYFMKLLKESNENNGN